MASHLNLNDNCVSKIGQRKPPTHDYDEYNCGTSEYCRSIINIAQFQNSSFVERLFPAESETKAI